MWMQTYTGERFAPLAPQIETVNIIDIAHALSLQCRYNGHCREFYSVAQHSILVSDILPDNLMIYGLLHDAFEAYMGDIIRPIKYQIPIMKAYEGYGMVVIMAAMSIPPISDGDWAHVKVADNITLATEARDLFDRMIEDWGIHEVPVIEKVYPMSPEESEMLFLIRYQDLTGRKVYASDTKGSIDTEAEGDTETHSGGQEQRPDSSVFQSKAADYRETYI